ncbi:hypothetical protein JYT15_00920 [Acidimicrobium ferrooxidans]|nr:hypothetical protein [Acidimicrobium ferrooxidans]
MRGESSEQKLRRLLLVPRRGLREIQFESLDVAFQRNDDLGASLMVYEDSNGDIQLDRGRERGLPAVIRQRANDSDLLLVEREAARILLAATVALDQAWQRDNPGLISGKGCTWPFPQSDCVHMEKALEDVAGISDLDAQVGSICRQIAHRQFVGPATVEALLANALDDVERADWYFLLREKDIVLVEGGVEGQSVRVQPGHQKILLELAESKDEPTRQHAPGVTHLWTQFEMLRDIIRRVEKTSDPNRPLFVAPKLSRRVRRVE